MSGGANIENAEARAVLRAHCDGLLADTGLIDLCTYVAPGELPSPFDRLLNHHDHMTTTLGDFYGTPVELRVLAERCDGDSYARKILLHTPAGGPVVEFGIVRINLGHIPPAVRDEILTRRKPLGDILIEHDLMREIEPRWFWKLPAHGEIAESFATDQRLTPYARVGRILVNGTAAIKLFEAVIDARAAEH